eukprot:scaffold6361_cov132-Isochrysis_galbana.AAC.12
MRGQQLRLGRAGTYIHPPAASAAWLPTIPLAKGCPRWMAIGWKYTAPVAGCRERRGTAERLGYHAPVPQPGVQIPSQVEPATPVQPPVQPPPLGMLPPLLGMLLPPLGMLPPPHRCMVRLSPESARQQVQPYPPQSKSHRSSSVIAGGRACRAKRRRHRASSRAPPAHDRWGRGPQPRPRLCPPRKTRRSSRPSGPGVSGASVSGSGVTNAGVIGGGVSGSGVRNPGVTVGGVRC